MENIIKSLKYIPKIGTALCYPLLLAMALLLFFGRNFQKIRIKSIIKIMPDFYSHISNFSISLIIYMTIGYIGMMFGLKMKSILLIGVLIVLLNLIVEFFVPILNTPDAVDAIFGISGVCVGLIILYVMKKFGLKNNEL